MHPIIAHTLAGVNALLGLVMAGLELQCVKYTWRKPWGWIRVLLMVMGFYWFGFYTWVAVTSELYYDAFFVGQVFVRPAFTITLLAMALAALRTYRNGGGCR